MPVPANILEMVRKDFPSQPDRYFQKMLEHVDYNNLTFDSLHKSQYFMLTRISDKE
jgi:hypothetical protein